MSQKGPKEGKLRPQKVSVNGQGNLSSRVRSGKDRKKSKDSPDFIKALQQNNASLATALDECRKELRDLHESFVSLQAERQLLLEKVIRLESKLTEQQNISEQVKPVFKLLEYSEKYFHIAQQHLHCLFSDRYSSECHHNLSTPLVSPISGLTPEYSKHDNDDHSKYPGESLQLGWHRVTKPEIKAHPGNLESSSDTVIKKGKPLFPKTPHPLVSLKLSSTPKPTNTEDQTPLSFVCEPKAINFDMEDSAIRETQAADTPLPSSVEPQDIHVFCKADRNFSAMSNSRLNKGKYSEGEDTKKSVCVLQQTDESDWTDSIKCEMIEAPSRQRPRRMCTSSNISYQEHSLRGKIYQGLPPSSGKTTCDHSENKLKLKKRTSNYVTRKIPLQDITNKRY